MKTIHTLIALFASAGALAQTTVQFTETHQFLDASKNVLKIGIQVNSMDAYRSPAPIMLEIVSDLEDPTVMGVTATRGIDKVIFPEAYREEIEIQIPIQIKALKDKQQFSLLLRKKGDNPAFVISQNTHAVFINKTPAEKSYISIAPVSGNTLQKDLADDEKIEIPFRLNATGYVPIEADKAVAKVNIKGIKEADGLYSFPIAGSASLHSLLIEKATHPELYEKIKEALNNSPLVELELSEVERQSEHPVEIDASRSATDIRLKKMNSADASYSFFLGTNFEFSTNFEAKDIYYQVDISLFNLFKSRWGLRAGLYKNTTSRYLEEFILRPTHYELVDETASGQVFNLIETGMAPSISTESLGFYFEIPYKIIDVHNFNVFITPHLEAIERREKYNYEIIYQSILSTEITSYPLDFATRRPLPAEVNSKYWEGYLGVGFPMLYRNPGGDFEVILNPIFGAGYPGPYPVFTSFYTGIPDYDYIQIVEDKLDPRLFTAFQFNIIINPKKSLGIKLGSDVRKFLGDERKPIVTVNLSTKLEFSKLFDLKKT